MRTASEPPSRARSRRARPAGECPLGPGYFTGAAAAGQSLASATLNPASNLTANTSCGAFLSFSAKVNLAWTATPSGFTSGHKVERWVGSTLQSTVTVAPRTTVALTQTGLATGTTYTWKVSAYVSAWTSTLISATATTPGLCL